MLNGVSSVPNIFQSIVDQIMQGMDHVMCFLDDILITAESEQEHLNVLDEVLTRLEPCGVRVNLTVFVCSEISGVSGSSLDCGGYSSDI